MGSALAGASFPGEIIDLVAEPILVLDSKLKVESVNSAFCRHFELEPEKALGQFVCDLGDGQWNSSELRAILERAFSSSKTIEAHRLEHEFGGIGRRVLSITARLFRSGPSSSLIFCTMKDVTENERLYHDLQGHVSLAEKLMDSVREALVVLNADLTVNFANQPFYDWCKFPRGEIEGKFIYEISDGAWDTADLRHLLEQILPERRSFDAFEVEKDFAGIGRRRVALNARRVDNLDLIILAIKDVTEERENEHARQERAALQQLIVSVGDELRELTEPAAVMRAASALLGRHLNAARVAYTEIDESGEFATVDQDWTAEGVESSVGRYRIKDFGSLVLAELQRGETLAINDVTRDARITGSDIAAYERVSTAAAVCVPLVKAGRLKAVLAATSATPRDWSGAEVTAAKEVAERTWAAVERARSERALRRSERRLRLASEAAGFGVYEFDGTRRTSYWSTGLQRIVGHYFGEKDVPYDVLVDIIHPDDRARVAARMAAAMRRPGPYELEFRILRPDGTVRWVLDRGEAFAPLDPDTRLAHRGAGTVIDISSRKAAEEELRKSEERLRLCQNAGQVGIWEWNVSTGELYWSDQTRAIFFSEDLETLNFEMWMSRIHPEDRESAMRKAEAALGESAYSDEYRIIGPDGTLRWIRATGQVENEDGRSTLMRGVVLDVTERKQQETQIRLLAGEVNHRAKNLLTVVQAIAAETARDAHPAEFALELMNRLQGLTASQDLIIRGNWEAVSLADLVDSQLRYLGSAIQRVHRTGDPVVVSPAAAQAIGMALHELATNAIKYGALSSRNGSVTINWERVNPGDTDERILFQWIESGGPPVEKPTRRGFGRSVIEDMAAYTLDADVELLYRREGVVWRLDAPASKVLVSKAEII